VQFIEIASGILPPWALNLARASRLACGCSRALHCLNNRRPLGINCFPVVLTVAESLAPRLSDDLARLEYRD